MAKIYYEKDADLSVLKDKVIGIVGYGSQGHAQSQNLRDSGINVVVSELKGSENYDLAVKAGWEVLTTSELAKKADIIQILAPDELQASIYQKEVAPYLEEGNALVFSHGFNIRYDQIIPPKFVDVYMVAPKGPGHLVRSVFVEGHGVPCLIAIEQDYTGNAKKLALAQAKGIGAARAGVIETTFTEETETDLFGEQAVLCGGVTSLIKEGFKTLTDAGYQPEIAYFEVCNELKLITDLIYQGGLSYMRYSISNTAEYGDYVSGPKVINEQSKQAMKDILTDIQNGKFARDFLLENKVGSPVFNSYRRTEQNQPIEKVGRKLRQMMSWLGKKK